MKVPKTFLNKFDVIEREGATELKSMVTVNDSFLQGDDNERYFVPLKALKSELYEDLVNLLNETSSEDIDIEELYPYIHSGIIWANKVTNKYDLPVKGEKVIATFEEGDSGDLRCSGIVMIGKFKSNKFNLYESLYKIRDIKEEDIEI